MKYHIAESKDLILMDYRQFFMWHVGDIERRYTLNKERLPDDMIEDMRHSYAKALKFIKTEENDMKEEVAVSLLTNIASDMKGMA